MKKIYSIGEVLVDMMMTDFPSYEAKFGGAPANVAMNLAKFQGKSYFLGNVGVDHLGQSLYQTMQKAGIDLSYATQSGKTTLAFVSGYEKGERDFQFYSESDQDYHLPASLKLSKDHMVHFGGATDFLKNDLEKAYWDLFNQAVDKQAFISFDPNYRQDLITDLDHFKKSCYQMIDKADLIKLSLEEAAVLYGTTDYQDLEKKMKLNEKQILLVTLGEAGAYLAYTPFLNKLSQESLFFNNFYPQHYVGTSSDSEFTFSTSLYPINNRTVFIDHADKEYSTIQKL